MRLGVAIAVAIGVACSVPSEPASQLPLLALEADSLPVDSTYTLVGAGDIAGCDVNLYRDEATARAVQAVIDTYPNTKVLALGDNAYPNNKAANIKCFDDSWGKFKPRMLAVLGNHDCYGDTTCKPWYDYMNGVGVDSGAFGKRGRGYRVAQFGGWQLLLMNSELRRGGQSLTMNQQLRKGAEEQAAWLKSYLPTHPAKCQLAFSHRPVFTSYPGTQTYWVPVYKQLYNFHVEGMVVGHMHAGEVTLGLDPFGVIDTLRGVRTFLAGTGGENEMAPNAPAKPYTVWRDRKIGVMVFKLYPDSLNWSWRDTLGVTAASGTAVCR